MLRFPLVVVLALVLALPLVSAEPTMESAEAKAEGAQAKAMGVVGCLYVDPWSVPPIVDFRCDAVRIDASDPPPLLA